MKIPRPKSILWFERFYFANLGIMILNEYVMWPTMVAEMEWDSSSHLIMWFFLLLILLLFWYFLAIRAKAWARWAQIIVTGLGIVVGLVEIVKAAISVEDDFVLTAVWSDLGGPEAFTGLHLISSLLNLVGTAFLFRKDAVQWFEGRKLAIEGVFD